MERHVGRGTGQPELATGTLPSTEKAAKKLALEGQIEEQQIAALENLPRQTAKLGGAGSGTLV